MVTLGAAENLMPVALADFNLILTRQLKGSLGGFRSARREVNRSAAKTLASEFQQLLRVLFRYRRGELAAVDEFQLCSLLGHCGGNFTHTMTDEVDRGRS